MKKKYTAPTVDLTRLKSESFLDLSGDAWGEDKFDDNFGERFQ